MPAIATAQCDLCGLPARTPVLEPSLAGSNTFCCQGCRNVWRILRESGQLEGDKDPRQTPIYQQAFQMGLLGPSENPSTPYRVPIDVQAPRKGSALDDQRQCVLRIDGMWCMACSWLIEKTLEKQKGVVSAEVSFASDTARVVYKPARTGEDALRDAVQSLGYASSIMGEDDAADPRVQARRSDMIRVTIGFAFAMNVMMLSFVLYAGYTRDLSTGLVHWLPWLIGVLSIPVFFCAAPIFRRALLAARQGAATMETLVSLGSGVAAVYSTYQLTQGSARVYFDTADMLLGLVMVGKFIESGVRAQASDALTLLYGLMPKKACVLKDGREVPVAVEQLAPDDIVFIRPGERVPADAVVTQGAATVDESLLSGESRPVQKTIQDDLAGGTILLDGTVTARIRRVGSEGTLAQIIALVEAALRRRTPAERWADKISRVFVPLILCLAAGTGLFLAFGLHAPLDAVLTRVVAVLVIACPCALGIATPMAMAAGVGAAARAGILIADGGAFETLTRLRLLVFDKTGTLTEGRFAVRTVIPENADLTALAALENASEHPIARALVRYVAEGRGEPLPSVTEFERIDGSGVRGCVRGVSLYAGNARLAAASGSSVPPDWLVEAEALAANGLTVIYWGTAGEPALGIVALGDTPRNGAREAIEELTDLGIASEVVSGDAEATTRAVAAQTGLTNWRAQALPQDKASWIEERVRELADSRGSVGMVGDGVNDAPALARADIGIAMASGTDIAARAAQVTLLSGDLKRLPFLVRLARATASIMRQNLFWAFAYNLICVPLAMLGRITPIWAAMAMVLSSVTVLVNTQRLKRVLPKS